LPLAEFVGPPERARLVASPVLDKQGDLRGVSTVQYAVPVRRYQEEEPPLETVGTQFSPLSAALLSAYSRDPDDLPCAISPHLVRCAGRDIPIWPARRLTLFELGSQPPETGTHSMLINWVGPVGSFPTYPLSALLNDDAATLKQRFAGKIVLVGSTAERFFTPMSGRSAPLKPGCVDQSAETSLSGTEIHANALNTMLTERYLRLVPRAVQLALVFVLAFVAGAAFQAWSEWVALALTGALLAGLYALAYGLARQDLWLPAVIPTAAMLGSAVVSAFWGFARVRHEVEELATEAEVREAVTETVVHDLKQPLAAIGALATVLRKRQQREASARPENVELLEHIQQQVDRAIGDIDDLLAATPAREIGLAPQRFDLVQLARDIAEVQRLKSSYHDVEVLADPAAIWVRADPRYMSRVFSNLVDNAIKYWPEGGTVQIQLRLDPPWAEARVMDHGLGISPEQRDRIFARFGRAVPEGMSIPGAGIGLFSVHRIVTAHHGEIGVQSEVGVGSTFVVRIPADRDEPQDPEGGC
jgi:signal transduction histidine kinase